MDRGLSTNVPAHFSGNRFMQASSQSSLNQGNRGPNLRMALSALLSCIVLVGLVSIVGLVGCGDGSTIEVRRYDTGVIRQEKTMRPGPGGRLIQDGPMIIYYESGNVKEEMTYDKGRLQGTVTEWYETGNKKHKKSESVWEEGRLVGEWMYWDFEGNLEETEDD